LKNSLSNKTLENLLKDELEVLKQGSHPHILRAIEILEDNKYYYIASEVLVGGEL